MRPAPRSPRRPPVDTTTTRAVYLPYPLFQRCREYADRYGISTAHAVRHLLDAGLEHVTTPPPRWEKK